ncbi:hypothetical protein LTR17_017097 [Elasticomyces elasticus]|nr:hypothetical protein LTR17_017097 [Elasticomyces elasticus]
MAILKRLSEIFKSYVSPAKTDPTPKTATPETAPNGETRNVHKTRQTSLEDMVRQSRSMSPGTRVGNWRNEPVAGTKRKQPYTPSPGAGRRSKALKMEDRNAHYADEYDDSSDVDMEDVGEQPQQDEVGEDEGDTGSSDAEDDENDDEQLEDAGDEGSIEDDEQLDEYEHEEGDSESEREDDMGDLAADISATHLRSSSQSPDFSEADFETSFVSEAEYGSPSRRKVINLPTEASSRGVSTGELRAEGWSDDHITLMQRLALRGFEALLPDYWKYDFPYLPDVLFQRGNDEERTFASSVRQDHIRGIKAIIKLFEMGGRIRDRLIIRDNLTPELQARRIVQEYIKWTDRDADLDIRTAIPIIAIEAPVFKTSNDIIEANTLRKMKRLYSRYREAFSAHPSIENSPSSDSTSNLLSQPVPQIYGLIASRTLVVLVAYRPDTPEQQVRTVMIFDFKDKDYDVWSSLALAIILCHARDVRCSVAEETGLGVKVPGQQVEEDDPDL